MNNSHWWNERVFYQVYLPSFCDGNNDGLGDFHGLLSKIDYLADLGIKGLWVTPFYPSPLVDNGYDISDYCAVDPRFGDIAAFKAVLDACHQRGMKVVIDVVINHVSDQHPWFLDAWNNPQSPWRDFFIFSDQPNNWQSFFSGSAWSKEPDTGQHYYHKFSPQQVDLNWSNPRVEQEIRQTLDFWIAQGVDGFRFDVINFLTTDGITADNPEIAGEQQHDNDINQPGLSAVLARLCRHIRQQGDYFLIGEVGSEDLDILQRYQRPELLDVVFNFNLGSQKTFSANAIYQQLKAMEQQQSGVPTLFFSSHDMSRMISRFGESPRDTERAIAVMALQISARGVPFIFQGEENGMTDYQAQALDQIYDIQGQTHYHSAIADGLTADEALAQAIEHSRDGSRSPCQWNDAAYAGFSTRSPWMPVNANYPQVNARAMQGDQGSIFHAYQTLIALRNQSQALQKGEYVFLECLDECLYFSRRFDDETVTVAINFGSTIVNPCREIDGELLYGEDAPLLSKNHIVIKRKFHGKA
ncbi:alpha-amylase family glycosyl hydrolase [Buttiauxella izardii]|uniref:DUF3459 domain-containing protein n=1 Tax=Buttiauxella izardii TaxID=82991 RepID=A0A3A5JUP0_9ENTR|nr:alpha-amylase family glycosyl hydrolase [Buttiauxella izardii]RJT20939.1 DUF3459 domain-containing protein [Buttiauxella izardii]